MAETWGNGHYSCYGCSEQSNKDSARCRECFTYTPLMQPYYQNWTQEKKQTNADRIRAMSDEELAKFLVDVETNGYHDQSVSGTLEMIDWLKSEVEQ